MFDSGRTAHVEGGIIGLSLRGSNLHTGGRPMHASPDYSGATHELAIAEKLDVAHYELRMWIALVAALETEMVQQSAATQPTTLSVEVGASTAAEQASTRKAANLFTKPS